MSNETENENSIEFDVTMSSGILYDYLISHAYTGGAGLLGTCFGAVGIVMFAATNYVLYLIFGLVLILYLPIKLKMTSLQLMQMNETYKKPLHYRLDENGITVSQGEETQTASWDSVLKAVSTKQSIVVYTGKHNASVFPRKQLGDNLPMMLSVMAAYIDPKKMRIRY